MERSRQQIQSGHDDQNMERRRLHFGFSGMDGYATKHQGTLKRTFGLSTESDKVSSDETAPILQTLLKALDRTEQDLVRPKYHFSMTVSD